WGAAGRGARGGAGACGLVAALAATEAGADVVVLERDALPAGSTALSSGLVPAAGTRFQRAKGIADDPARFAADVLAKNKHRADPSIVAAVTSAAAGAVEWLADSHGVPFELVEGFTYPGHSALRMHGTPRRTGRELMDCLLAAAARAGIEILTRARATVLYADDEGRVRGLAVERPDGSVETIGCATLVLASNGYGGNKALVRRHIPEMADALYFGHPGNEGDALLWGEALGAGARDLGAYQGHGSVAHPHGILVTWALMTEGGIQVNAAGRRFSNEHRGYSEQAIEVLAQPGGVAFDIYDARCEAAAVQFEDYLLAQAQGAVKTGETAEELAAALGLPAAALAATLAETEAMARGEARDPFGRDFTGKPPLRPPYRGIRVTGALFHTQGGLVVDADARVLRADGTPLPNLFAGGGAARGVSGPTVEGYLSGNGLLTAVTLGRAAGTSAARAALRAR
ncbi:MAG: FAD-binding protein, partial [Rhodospirillales bacterium]|nr:FAD-binding protein [Rhodospirillales bacterium]